MASEKYELLKKLIQEYRREEIRAQLKKGIMKEIPEEERSGRCRIWLLCGIRRL